LQLFDNSLKSILFNIASSFIVNPFSHFIILASLDLHKK